MNLPHSRLNKTTLAALVAISLIYSGFGCKREAKHMTKAAQSLAPAALSSGANTLLNRVPQDAYGFLSLDLVSSSYQKYKNSSWGKQQALGPDQLKGLGKDATRFIETVKKMGIDPANPNDWEKPFSKSIMFLTPLKEGETLKPGFGVVFESKDFDLKKNLSILKTAIEKEKKDIKEVKDITIGDASGIELVTKKNDSIYLVNKGSLGVIGLEKAVIQKVIDAKGDTPPTVVSSPEFLESTKDFSATRFGLGYIDIKRMVSELGELADNEKASEFKDLGLQNLAFFTGMEDTPKAKFRVNYNQTEKNKAFYDLAGSSAKSIVGRLQQSPLFFLSLDGAVLRAIQEQASKNAPPAQQAIVSQLAFLKNIKRFALTTQMAPIGQSILPIPDIAVMVESDDVPGLQSFVEAMALQALGQNAAGGWKTKALENGTSMKYMMVPPGITVALAQVENILVATNSENQIAALSGSNKGFGTSQASAPLTSSNSISNLYIDFKKLAEFLENMGGLAAMYAPQNKDVAEILQPENIASLKNAGAMLTSISNSNGQLTVDIDYTK